MIDCKGKEYDVIEFSKGVDLMGQTFGALVPISRVRMKDNKEARWLCECELCGNLICVKTNHLVSGHTKTCGCQKKKDDSEIERILNGIYGDNGESDNGEG